MKEKRYRKSLHFIVASIFCCSFYLQAVGLVQSNQSLLNDLSWLSNHGLIDISLSTWLLSNEEISASLDNSDLFNTEEKLVVQRVLSYINRQKNNINVQAFASSNTQKLPSDFAKANYSRYSLSAQANLSDDVWKVNLAPM